MKKLAVEDSVGMVLGHDLTRIVAGESKGPAFRRGHVVRPEDIPRLLDIGKEHLYVFDLAEGLVHEDDAARRIAAAAAGPGIGLDAPSEGKVTFTALHDGLLAIHLDALRQLARLDDVVFSTIHANQVVKAGRALAGTRVVPLVASEDLVQQAEGICRENAPLIEVKPLRPCKVGLVTTGSEIYKGRIKDAFGPVLRRKFAELGSEVIDQVLVSDDRARTVEAIHALIAAGAEMVALTGGMSVDPDDQTPAAIRATGARVVSYGAPVLPGAMFMLAYLGGVPLLGLPGCVMYYKASIFDLVVPRILSGEEITREDIALLAHGSYCEGCKECRYPVCGFGK